MSATLGVPISQAGPCRRESESISAIIVISGEGESEGEGKGEGGFDSVEISNSRQVFADPEFFRSS